MNNGSHASIKERTGEHPKRPMLEVETTTTLVDARETANRLGIAYQTLRHMVMRRQIPFIKIGRRCLFDPAAIERWIDERRVEPLVHPTGGRNDE